MSTSGKTPSVVAASLAKDRLGVFSVIMFSMTAAAPLLVVGGLVTAGWAATGITGLPLAFIVLGIILAVFSVGYIAMSRHVTNAGAFYSYIARGGSKPLGVGASFVALLGYNMLQIGLYGAFGVFSVQYFGSELNWTLHWWAYALIAWILVAIMGALRVDINSRILAILLAVEVAVVIVLDVIDFAHPKGGHVSVTTLAPHSLFVTGVGAAFAIAVTGFVGFEAAPVFSEESRNARKTVPMSTYLAIIVMGVIYTLTSWAIAVADGAKGVIDDSRNLDAPPPIFSVAARFLSENSPILNIGNVLLLTSVFAGLVSFHNSVTRYSFALGRERVLPSMLGRTRPRTGAPLVASIVQSVIALAVILMFSLNGWDPYGKLFYWLGTTGGFGILILLVATSLAVIKFFASDHMGESFWTRVIAPVLATIALGWITYETLNGYGSLLGTTGPAKWIFPSLYGVVAVIGILWALYLKSSQPDVYSAIGLGATANVVVPGPRSYDAGVPDSVTVVGGA
jgi:amino acid transporter